MSDAAVAVDWPEGRTWYVLAESGDGAPTGVAELPLTWERQGA